MTIPNIIRLGHAIFTVTDLARSRWFYVDVLGLNVLHESSDAIYLRGVEDREWSLKLELSDRPRVRQFGFKVGSDSDLDMLAQLAQSEGLPHRWEVEKDRPRMLRMQDPWGFPMAFYFQSQKHPWLLQRFDLHRGPGIQRVDHMNVFTPNVPTMNRWYQEKLGFRLTEYSEDNQGTVRAAWLHRKGNVHDIAMTTGTGPRMHHFAFWMPDGNRITQLCDILAGAHAEKHIERGPGRHGISNALFLYLRDPDGHRTEYYTSDYLTVDPDFEPIRWTQDDSRRQQLWGAIAPKSWFTEGSVVEGFDGNVMDQTESHVALPAYIK
jgi:catechol 2,3-dioxygenase